VAAGWGNTGFGVTLLLMPLLYKCFTFFWGPQVAWRAAFFVPGLLQLAAGMLVLPLTDDTPEGRLPHMARCGTRW
jgi:nitrate/nitrite transporter NarK